MNALWTAWVVLRRPFLDPAESYRVFYRLIHEDRDRAFLFLSKHTLEAFRRAGQKLTARPDTGENPLAYFLGSIYGRQTRPLNKVDILEQDASSAVLRVEAGPCSVAPDECARGKVRMVREDNCWAIQPELPAALRPAE
jgi:hypothetical protein